MTSDQQVSLSGPGPFENFSYFDVNIFNNSFWTIATGSRTKNHRYSGAKGITFGNIIINIPATASINRPIRYRIMHKIKRITNSRMLFDLT